MRCKWFDGLYSYSIVQAQAFDSHSKFLANDKKWGDLHNMTCTAAAKTRNG